MEKKKCNIQITTNKAKQQKQCFVKSEKASSFKAVVGKVLFNELY